MLGKWKKLDDADNYEKKYPNREIEVMTELVLHVILM